MNKSGKTLILVDGMNLLCNFASFVTAFMVDGAHNDIMETIAYLDPHFGTDEAICECLFVWDPIRSGGSSAGGHVGFRHDTLPIYKANRGAKRSAIVHASDHRIHLINQLAKSGIRSVVQHGLEADDYIAYIAHLVAPRQTVIVSQDGDFLQLVSPSVSILREQGWIDHSNFCSKIGLTPEQHLAWKVLSGDPSDNIPPIRSKDESWLWAVSGASLSELSDDELALFQRNRSIIRLALWENNNAVHPGVWENAKRQFRDTLTPATYGMIAELVAYIGQKKGQ